MPLHENFFLDFRSGGTTGRIRMDTGVGGHFKALKATGAARRRRRVIGLKALPTGVANGRTHMARMMDHDEFARPPDV